MMTNKDIKTAHEMCPRNGFINGSAHASAKGAAVGWGEGPWPLGGWGFPRICHEYKFVMMVFMPSPQMNM